MKEIIISPDFGAGWSTWNHEPEVAKFMLFSPKLIQLLRNGGTAEEAEKIIREGCALKPTDHVCVLGWKGAEVVEVSGAFTVEEYDGSESIRTAKDLTYYAD